MDKPYRVSLTLRLLTFFAGFGITQFYYSATRVKFSQELHNNLQKELKQLELDIQSKKKEDVKVDNKENKI